MAFRFYRSRIRRRRRRLFFRRRRRLRRIGYRM